MSYFKYAERSADSRVDWGAISKQMVDMLNEQTRLRNEKLDEAQARQTAITTKVSEAPIGGDEDVNQVVSNFAGDVTEYSAMMKRLWRSGKLSYREYMASTSNLLTNTTAYFGQAQKYADSYQAHMDRMQPDENGFVPGSDVEVAALARVEEFGNFSRYRPEIDAPTGNLFLVDSSGKRYAGVTELGVQVLSTYDRINLPAQVSNIVDSVGARTVVLNDGTVETVTSALERSGRDPEAKAAYEEAEDGFISTILGSSDNATTSTLVDYSGGNFQSGYISDAATLERASDKNSNIVVMMPSPNNPNRIVGSVEDDVTEVDFKNYLTQMGVEEGSEQFNQLVANRQRQKKLAQSFVRNMVRAGLEYTETPQEQATVKPPSLEEQKYMDEVAARNSMAGHWMTILTGNAEQKDVAIGALETLPNVQQINESADQVIVTFVNSDGTLQNKAYPKTQVGRRDRVTETGEVIPAPRLNVYDWALTGMDVHGTPEDELARVGVDSGLISVDANGNIVMVGADTEANAVGTRANILTPVDFGSGKITIALPKDVKIKNTVVPAGTATEFTPEGALDAVLEVADNGQQYEEGVTRVLDAMFDGDITTAQIVSFPEETVKSKTSEQIEQDVLRVMVPELMEYPVFIPIDKEHSAAEIKALTRVLEDAANNNVMVSQEDIKNFMESIRDEEYKKLVSETNRIMKGNDTFTRRERPARTAPAPSSSAPRPRGS